LRLSGGLNIARQSLLAAALPISVPGAVVSRFCASGLEAIVLAAQRIQARDAEVIVAGGIESISCVAPVMNQHMLEEAELKQRIRAIYLPMPPTAELVAQRYWIDKDRQDAYGVRSQQRAAAPGKIRVRGAFMPDDFIDAGSLLQAHASSVQPLPVTARWVRPQQAELHSGLLTTKNPTFRRTAFSQDQNIAAPSMRPSIGCTQAGSDQAMKQPLS
jgi:hypothetical protein